MVSSDDARSANYARRPPGNKPPTIDPHTPEIMDPGQSCALKIKYFLYEIFAFLNNAVLG
jgi:hypothetical protein